MALFLAVEVRLNSGEAHGAPNLARWSPARPTALRPSPVEIRRAHSAQTLAGWSPARPTALRPLAGVKVRRGPRCAESRRLKSGEAHSAPPSPAEVRRGPQRSDSRRLRSGEAHSAQTLAGLKSCDSNPPARTIAIKSWQMRSGEAHCDQELADKVRRGRRRKKEELCIWHKI